MAPSSSLPSANITPSEGFEGISVGVGVGGAAGVMVGITSGVIIGVGDAACWVGDEEGKSGCSVVLPPVENLIIKTMIIAMISTAIMEYDAKSSLFFFELFLGGCFF
ncbi:MAG: hypothetical protein E7315_05535 [Clostridiales bacterium]|nr:hypothetical protein [Clostridiales bacterium]